MIVKTLWSNLAIQAATFVTSVLIARILGPTGRGELALVLLYPQLVAGVAFLGVDRAVAVLGGRGALFNPAVTVAKLALLFAIPAMAAGYAIVLLRVGDAHLAKLSILYLLHIPAMYFFLLVVSLFNGTGNFIRFNLTRLSFYAANFIIVFVIWVAASSMQLHLDWIVFANLVSVFAALAFATWMLRGFKLPEGGETASAGQGDLRSVLGLALVFTLPVMLTHISNFAYQVALENLMGVTALGFFVVYFSYTRLLSSIGNAVGSHVFHFGISGSSHDIARVFRLSLIVYTTCALPLWIVAGWLIPLIFGPDFVVDDGTVGLLFVSSVFCLLADSLAQYLNGQRKVNTDIVSRIIYLATLGILAGLLVPLLGLIGMAVALAVGDLLRCLYIVGRISYETKRRVSDFWKVRRVDVTTLIHVGKNVIHELFV
jgi:O-antigen/teichoic acid export membrane protein